MNRFFLSAVTLTTLLSFACCGADNAQGDQSSPKPDELYGSYRAVRLRVSGRWISLEKLLEIANAEIKLRKPQFWTADARPVVLLYHADADTNRIATIRYDLSSSTQSRGRTVPVMVDIGQDLGASIRETRLENDLLQTPPLR